MSAAPVPITSIIREAKVESWDDHVEAWHALGRKAEDAAWGRAAVAASLRHRYGEKAIEKFAAEVGQSRTNVFRLAQIHIAYVEKSRRRDNLSFAHHIEALTAPDPGAALEQAEREGWSVRDLRRHLHPKALPATTETAPATVAVDEKWIVKLRRYGRRRLVPRSPGPMAKFLVENLPSTDVRKLIGELEKLTGRGNAA